jgi:adenylate cyclase
MAQERTQRRLAAILAADVVGYSRLMERDEAGTFAALKSRRKEVLEPLVARHQGRIFKVAGDGVLVEFGSAVNAIQCAVQLQQAMATANRELPDDYHIVLRVGVNLGDVMVEGSDLYGDGINIASRLEALAEPGGILVAGTAYDYVRNKVKVGFDDLGSQTLKNIAEPVHTYRVAGTPAIAVAATKPVTDKPSIAVLPFVNLSGDPEQTYFSDGVTEDIITELCRFRSLFVIARNSSFAFRGERIDFAEVARRLGVQYIVEGSVRKAGNRIRITAQLIEAANAAHLWAERYDRELADIFAVQDEVVRALVAAVAGRVEVAGAEVARRKRPESLVAYDLVLQGMERLNLGGGQQHSAEAHHLFQKAVEIDPQYPIGHAYLALAIWLGWLDNRGAGGLERALASAQRAVGLDESDSRCHRILSSIYAHLRRYDLAELHSEKSLALNPNDALAAVYRGALLRWFGRGEESVEWYRKAMRLNPYHPNWYWNSMAHAMHSAGLYAEALDAYGRVAEPPSFHDAYVAACHAELGEMEKARAHAKLALEARPDFAVSGWGRRLPYKNEEDLQRFLNGFRKAGLPE